jgi:hypothetical protein
VRLRSAYETLHSHSISVLNRLWTSLSETEGVKLYGPDLDSPRTPTVAFTVQNMPSSEVARKLSDLWGVFLSHGDFYAATVIERLRLGPEGLVRAGCACYTTEEEIDRLIEGVRHRPDACLDSLGTVDFGPRRHPARTSHRNDNLRHDTYQVQPTIVRCKPTGARIKSRPD